MSWMTSDVERWLKNAGQGKVMLLSFVDGKISVEIEDGEGYVEGRSTSLVGAIDSAMSKLNQRAYSEPKAALPPVPAVPSQTVDNTSYPTCPDCGSYPTIVYCDERAECRCGVNNWTVPLKRGTRVKLTTGLVYEYDGALWDQAILP